MELRHTKSNSEIVLKTLLNHVELLFLTNCENGVEKWIM